MARRALTQMDAAVDQTMSRSSTEQGADKAAQLRRSQANERNRLLKEIDTEQKKIQKISEERAPIAAEVRKVEAEVGPIKYIAALIYGDNPDTNLLEKSVRWVIILIVIVFDPLALTLLLAATKSIEWERGINILQPVVRKPDDTPDDDSLTNEQLDQINARLQEAKEDPEVTEFFDRAREKARAIDASTYQAPQEPNPYQGIKAPPADWYDHVDEPEPIKKKTILSGLDNMWSRAKNLVVKDSEAEHAPLQVVIKELDKDEEEKEARRRWKEANPDDTIHRQEALYRAGKIDQLPWHEELMVEADNELQGQLGEVKGFGTSFPASAIKGDMFLRVDQLPSVLYKFNGINWIEVDKALSDQHAYDDAYIDHLIEKIDTGEYDPDLLSDAERDRIEQRLKS
jgi:hypothetical protein